MGKAIPMSWLNQILLILSILSASLSLIIQEWSGLTSLPIYISILWAIFVVIMSVWFSCFLLQLTLKANKPLYIKSVNDWLYRKLTCNLKLQNSEEENKYYNDSESKANINEIANSVNALGKSKIDNVSKVKKSHRRRVTVNVKYSRLKGKRLVGINDMVKEINLKCIDVWYKSISSDKSFPGEAQELLKKILTKLFYKISLMDKVKLTHKLANAFLLHLKEYHRYEPINIFIK